MRRGEVAVLHRCKHGRTVGVCIEAFGDRTSQQRRILHELHVRGFLQVGEVGALGTLGGELCQQTADLRSDLRIRRPIDDVDAE